MEVFVDNSSGISFQQSTNPNTKLRGIYDMREAWVQELRNKFKVKAVKVHTEKNLADMFTTCLATTYSYYLATSVRRRLFDEIESIATQMTKNEVKAWAPWSAVKWSEVKWSQVKWSDTSEVWFYNVSLNKSVENLGGTYVTA